MPQTFFFYDLETSGLNPREDRIMQFAGQRTDENLNPIGEPYDMLVALSDDVLPSPGALLVTGITPQKTREEGYREAHFAQVLSEEVFTPDTIVVGFNNIRFDDEFIRHLFWRTFHDPYEWVWKDGRSRWDILDVIRLTRALRPEGIKWPINQKGLPVNKLELLALENDIIHTKAHDASSDVTALIGITKMLRRAQPQIYAYLLNMRQKKNVKKLVNLENKQPFVYASGRYDVDHNKTTVAFPLTAGQNGNVVVYDLRHDPSPFINLDQKELVGLLHASWDERKQDSFNALPVKELQYNRAPAIAPLSVLEQSGGWEKLSLSLDVINKHKTLLLSAPHFAENIRSVVQNGRDFKKSTSPEGQLYEGFLSDRDRLRVDTVRQATEQELSDFHPTFEDDRLAPLLLHYKARNYPSTLTQGEVIEWETWRNDNIVSKLPVFTKELQAKSNITTDEAELFILKELQLWAEGIVPLSQD